MRRGYKAFISYKHHADLPFAERIAKALRTYARPLLKPPLRTFRDEEYLLPNESLPKAIRAALEDSSFLVLLASPECAASVWVSEALQIWCTALQRSNRLLIVLTHGEIVFAGWWPAVPILLWGGGARLRHHTSAIPRAVGPPLQT